MIFRVYQGNIGEFGTYQNFRKTDCQIIDIGKSDLLPSTKCGQLCGTAVVFCTAAVTAIIGKEEQRLIKNLIHCHCTDI